MEDIIITEVGSQCKVNLGIAVLHNYPSSLHTSTSLLHYCVPSAKITVVIIVMHSLNPVF